VQGRVQKTQKISKIGTGRSVRLFADEQFLRSSICVLMFHMSTNARTRGFAVSTAWNLSSLVPGGHLNIWTDAPVVTHKLQACRLRRATTGLRPPTDSDRWTRLTRLIHHVWGPNGP